MKIVRLKSGLGNQMFQYALYKELMYRKQDVKLDLTYISKNVEHNGYELNKVFNVTPRYATEEDIKICEDNGNIYYGLRKKLTGKETFSEIERGINIDLFICDNILIDGYWQNIKYFTHVKEELRKEYRFSSFNDTDNIACETSINNSNSVALHVRKGDYLSQGFKDYYGSICDVVYYKKAIKYIIDNVKNPKFFIFSDDFDWVENNLELPKGSVKVTWNNGDNSYRDMQLMSICKNMIIANSTFSWWSAWLNENKGIIIAPSKWCLSKRKYKNALCLKEWNLI